MFRRDSSGHVSVESFSRRVNLEHSLLGQFGRVFTVSNLKKAPSISLGIVFHADSSVVYDVKRRRSSMAIKDRQRLVDR